jgi:hypothetical protein
MLQRPDGVDMELLTEQHRNNAAAFHHHHHPTAHPSLHPSPHPPMHHHPHPHPSAAALAQVSPPPQIFLSEVSIDFSKLHHLIFGNSVYIVPIL